MNKEDVIYIQYPYTHTHTHTHEYYSAIKREILPFVTTWMDLEDIILSEKSDKKPTSTHMWNQNKNKVFAKRLDLYQRQG